MNWLKRKFSRPEVAITKSAIFLPKPDEISLLGNSSSYEEVDGALDLTSGEPQWSEVAHIDVSPYIGGGEARRLVLQLNVTAGRCGVSLRHGKGDGKTSVEQFVEPIFGTVSLDLGEILPNDEIVIRNGHPIDSLSLRISGLILTDTVAWSAFQSVTSSERAGLLAALTDTKNDALLSIQDRPLLPFVHRFVARRNYESEFALYVSSTRTLKNAYFTYKKAPLALFPAIQAVMGVKKPVYWDIGANIGVSTVQIGMKFEEQQGLVVALEPEPDNFFTLSENFRLNRLNKSVAIPVAAGNRKSLKWLAVNSTTTSQGGDPFKQVNTRSGLGLHTLKDTDQSAVGIWGNYTGGGVRVLETTIYDLIRDYGVPSPDYVFVDAAMYEDEVVEGLGPLLSNPKRPLCLLIEQTPGGASGNHSSDPSETFIWRLMFEHGYKAVNVESFDLKTFHPDHLGSYFLTVFLDGSRLSAELEEAVNAAIKMLRDESLAVT